MVLEDQRKASKPGRRRLKGDNMKLALTLVFALLVATVFISGCVKQQEAPSTGSQPLTAAEKEQYASNTLQQELDQAIGDMTLEDLENELLAQG